MRTDRVYLPIWVKLGVRIMPLAQLNIRDSRENRRSEGGTSLIIANEITFTLVPRTRMTF
jgi:hypothetical protein